MQRSRTSEVPQRPSSKLRGPQNLRTSSSDFDPLHHCSITERSPKLGIGDRQSPRSVQSDPLRQKKLGTRITDLETQLSQAQHELKNLKQQLASAEAVRKQAQEELHKKGATKRRLTTRKVQGIVKQLEAVEIPKEETKDKPDDKVLADSDRETDVFEVPGVEHKSELGHCSVNDGKEAKLLDSAILKPEKCSVYDILDSKGDEIDQLRSKMEEKEEKIKVISEENETLKSQVEGGKLQLASAHKKEEEMISKLNQLTQELEASKAQTGKLEEKVLEVEVARESLEAEMKKMKVQTEQWRKAADAAAVVLAGAAEMNGWVSERCASMDKHFNGIFEYPFNGYKGYFGSPGTGDDIDDGFERGKKKGSSIRMLGDLWKKKGHNKSNP